MRPITEGQHLTAIRDATIKARKQERKDLAKQFEALLVVARAPSSHNAAILKCIKIVKDVK